MTRYLGPLLLWILGYVSAAQGTYANCNKTWRSADLEDTTVKPLTVSLTIRPEDHRKAVKCRMNFIGKENEIVQVKITSVRAGSYDKSLGTCVGGHLKVFDGLNFHASSFPPTVLCGYHEAEGPLPQRILVKRFSSRNSSRVEFFVLEANTKSGFDIEVTFYNKRDKKGLKQVYGSYPVTKGRIPDTKCDWRIPINDCSNGCFFVTPGYPGIYPPNTKCRYYLTNVVGERIELYMSSSFRVKFDMKKSNDCSEDYVKVFEGNSTDSPLIGKFCGHDGKVMISKSESLLVEFNSGPGGPKWDYSGFEASVQKRWGIASGRKIPNTVCDWTFDEPNDTKEGTLNTADHQLPRGTICNYRFRANPNERIEFSIVIKKMGKNCVDYIEIDDEKENDKPATKICWEDLKHQGRRNEYKITTLGPNATIRYIHNGGQISNIEPIFIDYIFLSDPSYNASDAVKPDKGYTKSEPDGTVGAAGMITFNLGPLLIITILAALL
ncbi:tolloid-like protein 1 isoform X1 [Lineus longissimus]|uniref:tolloid-like protein 1 isoform X1 n=1 Tax=Lineus longissimus TaxID=88925 RepID=UPI002B4C6130